MELDRTTFRRLVQLYLLSYVLNFSASLYESYSPAWRAFSDEFDRLVDRYVTPPADAMLYSAAAACMISIVWHVVSVIGLLRFRRWARWGFWASVLISLPFIAAPAFMGPFYVGFWGSVMSLLNSMLFGIVLLLAYSSQHGAAWFTKDNQFSREGN